MLLCFGVNNIEFSIKKVQIKKEPIKALLKC